MSKPTIYDRMRQIYEGLGITRHAFAKRMNVHPPVVYQWLDKGGQPGFNITDPKIAQIVETYGKYGVTTDWLKYGVGPAPDFSTKLNEDPSDDDRVDSRIAAALAHLQTADEAVRANRPVETWEAIEAARQSLTA